MSGTGLQITVDDSQLAAVAAKLNRLGRGADPHEILDVISAEVESQTRRRIESEKASPEGGAWPAWSPDYAAKRHGGHSLLVNEGELLDSIQRLVSGKEAQVGTNLIYGAIHQFGGDEVDMDIPAREYLGISDDNRDDLEALVDDWVEGLLAA